MAELHDNWLDIALTHATTAWLKQFLAERLSILVGGELTSEAFTAELEAQFAARNLTTASQQKNYRSNVVQALKSIASTHPAIDLISLSRAEYRELGDKQRGKLAATETKYLSPQTAEQLVSTATALLKSGDWATVGAGLAALIGRRVSEILLSRFELKTDWSILFFDPSKKPTIETDLAIEIPTLAPASRVIDAIQKLQTTLRIDDIKSQTLTPKAAKQQINQRYSEAIAKACDQHYSSLILPRADKDNLYTHIFRACYATIAAHWFCPPNVPEHNYKAEIQGHFTFAADGTKLPNYSARANYDDYAIGTSDGNRDGRLGIKLGKLPGLQVIDAFCQQPLLKETIPTDVTEPAEPIETPVAQMPKLNPPTEKVKTKRPELYVDDLAKMTEIMANRGVVGSAAQLFHTLIETFELEPAEPQQQQTQTIAEVASTLNWFTGEIQSLRAKIADLEQERDRLQAAQIVTEELSRLRSENTQLQRELQDTQSRLEGIQKFLGGLSQPVSNNWAPATTAQTLTPSVPSTPPVLCVSSVSSAPRTREGAEATASKINSIIDAIHNWNLNCADNRDMIRVGIQPIKAIASKIGADYQPAIQSALEARKPELETFNHEKMLSTRHNATVRAKDKILQTIARDFLNIENWAEVRYP